MTRKQEILDQIKHTLQSQLNGDLKGAWLIGSQARLGVFKRSDIDIAIETEGVLSPTQLNHLKNELNNLRTLFPIDLVWLNDATPTFQNIALSHAESLLTRSHKKK